MVRGSSVPCPARPGPRSTGLRRRRSAPSPLRTGPDPVADVPMRPPPVSGPATPLRCRSAPSQAPPARCRQARHTRDRSWSIAGSGRLQLRSVIRTGARPGVRYIGHPVPRSPAGCAAKVTVRSRTGRRPVTGNRPERHAGRRAEGSDFSSVHSAFSSSTCPGLRRRTAEPNLSPGCPQGGGELACDDEEQSTAGPHLCAHGGLESGPPSPTVILLRCSAARRDPQASLSVIESAGWRTVATAARTRCRGKPLHSIHGRDPTITGTNAVRRGDATGRRRVGCGTRGESAFRGGRRRAVVRSGGQPGPGR